MIEEMFWQLVNIYWYYSIAIIYWLVVPATIFEEMIEKL